MTLGTFLLVAIAGCALLLLRAIDKARRAGDRRSVQLALAAFLARLLGAAAPLALVYVQLVQQTRLNQGVAGAAFVIIGVRLPSHMGGLR